MTLRAPIEHPQPGDIVAEIALVIGGGQDVFAEYETAKNLCANYNKITMNFVCNSTIPIFPEPIDNAVTLHPDKMTMWLKERLGHGYPEVHKLWAHRPVVGFTNNTKDWGGSSGLLCVKIARELGFVKVILCGVPMTVEGNHVVRKSRWNAAHGFRRGWMREMAKLRPFVRSLSGWTAEQFGQPDREWIDATIPDRYPMRNQRVHLRA